MSKYQKLDSEQSKLNINNHNDIDDDDDDDDGNDNEYEKSFSFYFDDKYKRTNKNNKNNATPTNTKNNNSSNKNQRNINDYNDSIIISNNNNNKNGNSGNISNLSSNNKSKLMFDVAADSDSANFAANVSAANHMQSIYNTSNVNGNNIRSSSLINIAQDFEDNTMEVPLLHSNSNNNLQYINNNCNNYNDNDNDNDRRDLDDNATTECRCTQPGFGVNLECKSAQEARYKMLLAILLCCVFMIIEFLGGYMAGSLAIMTDAAHLASDCISFVIGVVAIWLGGRPPDRRMSFGYKRLEVLGALVSILGIWILTATLVLIAIERIYSNDFDLDVDSMMIISGIGILINIAMIFILHSSWFIPSGHGHGHSHSHSHGHGHSHVHGNSHNHSHKQHSGDRHSQHELNVDASMDSAAATTIVRVIPNESNSSSQNGLKPIQSEHIYNGSSSNHSHNQHTKSCSTSGERNLNLRAAMIHVIGDLVQSIGVFLAAVLIKFCPSAKYADPLCTLLFSVIVIMTTVQLFKESLGILLDAVPGDISMYELEMDLTNIEGVKSAHHLNVWSHTSQHSVLMVHLVIDLLTDSNTVLDKATQLAASSKYNIKHSTVQIERLSA